MYSLSQIVYDFMRLLGLEYNRVYFFTAMAIWLLQYLVCAKKDRFLATGLFAVSRYWLKRVLNPGCLSVAVVCWVVHYLYSYPKPNRIVALLLVMLTGSLEVTSFSLLLPVLLYCVTERQGRFTAMGLGFLIVGLLVCLHLDVIQNYLTPEFLPKQYTMQLTGSLGSMGSITFSWCVSKTWRCGCLTGRFLLFA